MNFQREPNPRYWPTFLALAILLIDILHQDNPLEAQWVRWLSVAAYAALVSYLAGDALAFVSTVLVFGLIGAHSSTLLLDLSCAILVSGGAVLLRMTQPKIQRHPILVALGTVFVTSLLLTGADHLKHTPLIASSNTAVKFPGTVKVGLALSGGGYRAALLHAGVLDGLRSFGIPVSSIASVSGGSIAATAYWEGIEPRALVQGIIEGKFSLYRKLLDLNFISGYTFVLPGTARRRAQESVLDDAILNGQLFEGMACPEGSSCAGRPKLMLIASDLASGTAVGFLPQGFLTHRTASTETPPGLFDNVPQVTEATFPAAAAATARWFPAASQPSEWIATLKASTLVATSGAFPGAFEPYTLAEGRAEYHQLTDGGVMDNSAITLLLDADLFARNCADRTHYGDLLAWRQDVVIESDGTMPYDTTGAPRTGELGTALNAIDAAYARVLPRPLYLEGKLPHPPTILLAPVDIVLRPASSPGSVLEDHVRALLREIAERDKTNARETFRKITRAVGHDPKNISESQLRSLKGDSGLAGASDSGGGNPLYFPDERELDGAIALDAKAFYEAPTLSASFEAQDAYHIYRLGWLLVALNSARLRAAMATGAATDKSPEKQICPGDGRQ
jgi:predicted acylesterase/phospholipase RssA